MNVQRPCLTMFQIQDLNTYKKIRRFCKGCTDLKHVKAYSKYLKEKATKI